MKYFYVYQKTNNSAVGEKVNRTFFFYLKA